MPYRAKTREPLTERQCEDIVLDVKKHCGDLDPIRKKNQSTTRREFCRALYSLSVLSLTSFRLLHDLIVKQGNLESQLAEMRKPAARETGRGTAAGSGGRAA